MGLRKGQASEAYKQGKLEKYNLKNRTPEERHEIAMKGAIARIEKQNAKKAMKEQLELLLSLDVKSRKHKEVLKDMGIMENEMTNQMLMITALYKKALTGDVAAFKQINDIVNGQEDLTPVQAQAPVINIVGVSPKNVRNDNGNITIENEEW